MDRHNCATVFMNSTPVQCCYNIRSRSQPSLSDPVAIKQYHSTVYHDVTMKWQRICFPGISLGSAAYRSALVPRAHPPRHPRSRSTTRAVEQFANRCPDRRMHRAHCMQSAGTGASCRGVGYVGMRGCPRPRASACVPRVGLHALAQSCKSIRLR